MHLNAVEEQRSVARIAGAVAHELNNPLQGILSLVAMLVRETRLDDRSQSRIAQIHSGLSRISRTVDSLSAVYENLPRSPDHISAQQFIEFLHRELNTRAILVASLPHDSKQIAQFLCFAPEVIRLTADLFSEVAATLVHIEVEEKAGRLSITCQGSPDNKQDAESDAWQLVQNIAGIAGLPIFIDQLVRFSGGEVEFQWRDIRFGGIRFLFRTLMEEPQDL